PNSNLSVSDPIALKSDRGIDYTQLRDFLAQGQWQDADRETAKVMLEVANRGQHGYLKIKDIENFPCEDFNTIDQLWLHYSNGKFGFSVQAELYRSLGGTKNNCYGEVMERFGDIVGWRKGGTWLNYSDLTFEVFPLTNKAYLPLPLPLIDGNNCLKCGFEGGWGVCVGVGCLFSCFETCNLNTTVNQAVS
ncbi:MAG: GUN4 domain-containing protein, partial [Microcystaceae cyanobacterium]